MPTAISAVEATGAVSAASQVSASSPALVPSPKTRESNEDSVQLSASAQQFLQASQAASDKTRGLVAQLVQAAANGDPGALSLLTVI